jgi:hypothetical protein
VIGLDADGLILLSEMAKTLTRALPPLLGPADGVWIADRGGERAKEAR